MNYQETFDKVATHLLKQNEKAESYCGISGETACKYKTSTGLKCAIGILIPDGHEAQETQMNVDDLLKHYPDLAILFGVDMDDDPDFNCDADFLMDLQGIHDNHGAWHWNEELKEFAIKHELSSKVCEV